MAGFPLDPNILAQLAASGFRPPQPPTMPGLNLSPQLMSPQQGPSGVSLRDGLSTLADGIQALKDWKPDPTIVNAGSQGSGSGGAYTTADAMRMAGLSGDPSDPGYGVPGGLGMSSGAGGDPLAWIRRQLGLPDFLSRW